MWLLAAFASLLWGAEDPRGLPRIGRLDPGDVAFRQYIEEVREGRRRAVGDRSAPEALAASLTIYAYVTGPGDDLIGVAARCMIPYETLATLNRLGHMGDFRPGSTLLLPSAPGIFAPVEPENDLERLILSSRGETPRVAVVLGGGSDGGGDGGSDRKTFWFYPGDGLRATERVFFLRGGFRFPLETIRVTDSYGPRVNPVTGRYGVHQGLDLAAPQGTAVYAAKDGEVRVTGEDPVYGRYVIISHDDGWTSLYGHLSRIETAEGRRVGSGAVIGRVGSTGQSTGPHLHFELRQNGAAKDPAKLLGIFGESR